MTLFYCNSNIVRPSKYFLNCTLLNLFSDQSSGYRLVDAKWNFVVMGFILSTYQP